jgi:hypothetical protein
MRSIAFPIIFIMLLANASCEKEDCPSEEFSVQEISYGACKSFKNSGIDEYLDLSSNTEFYLELEHVNSWFNCSPGQIIVDAIIENNRITVNEYCTDPSANCICPYDLNFTLGPLAYKNYRLVVKREGHEVLNEPFKFYKNLDLRLSITPHK